MTPRNCPLCDSDKKTVIHHQKFTAEALIPEYDVVVCDECGMGYATPTPTQNELDTYYAQSRKYREETAADKARLDETAGALRKIIHQGARVLDVGGGAQGLLKRLGMEPSNRPDFIILNNVLEHVRDCRRLLRHLYEFLPVEGRLWIEVPDPTSLNDAPFQQFSTEHINYFSLETLIAMAQEAGFIVDCLYDTGKDSHRIMGTRPKCYRISFSELADYVEASRRRELEIEQTLASLPSPIIVWGKGTLTLRWLAEGKLNPANIIGFVDTNPDVVAFRPEDVRAYPDVPIFVCSVGRRDEIVQQIREMGIPNEVITL
jgi:hypothetical protein